MPILTPEQLTGRVCTHVMEVSKPRCTLHPEAAAAFLELCADAQRSGIDLCPSSSFRDFDRQLRIWNDKFYGLRPLLDAAGQLLDRAQMDDEQAVAAILLWSALPGASRHHWGSEVDVFDRAALPLGQPRLVPAEFAPGGIFEKLGAWLPRHCADFGFFLPYDLDRGGVLPEPWHLSYAPVSSEALAVLTVEVLEQALAQAELAGAGVVRRQLANIHTRYVAAVARPNALALRRVNPAARPS